MKAEFQFVDLARQLAGYPALDKNARAETEAKVDAFVGEMGGPDEEATPG
jgi:hypothetical protein